LLLAFEWWYVIAVPIAAWWLIATVLSALAKPLVEHSRRQRTLKRGTYEEYAERRRTEEEFRRRYEAESKEEEAKPSEPQPDEDAYQAYLKRKHKREGRRR
jgi:hypothetical protein